MSKGAAIGLFERLPTAGLLVGALALVASIGWLDYAAGTYLSFSLFYLLPVGIVASFVGRGWGVSLAAICAICLLYTSPSPRD